MKLKIIAASLFLFAAVSIPSYLFLITDNKESVKTVKADPVQKVVSIPFRERFGHAYMVKDQPGGDEVTWIEWLNGSFTINRYNIVSKQKIATAIDLPKSTYFYGLVFAQQIDDIVWMGTSKWLARIDAQTGDHTVTELPAVKYAFDENSGEPLTLSRNRIHAITGLEIDDKENIWLTRMSASSLTKYTEGSGFQEFKAPDGVKEPQRPMAIQEGILIVNNRRADPEFEKSTAHIFNYIFKADGNWSQFASPGPLQIKNAYGKIFIKNQNADLIVNGKLLEASELSLTIQRIDGSLLSLGKNNEVWYEENRMLKKYSVNDKSKKVYTLPLDEAQETGHSIVFGSDPVPEALTMSMSYGGKSVVFDTAVVAKDGSFWASCMIASQLFIVGVPAN